MARALRSSNSSGFMKALSITQYVCKREVNDPRILLIYDTEMRVNEVVKL